MSDRKTLSMLMEELDALATMGCAVALHIRFATPLIKHSTYPEAWRTIYDENAYGLRDPLVFWGVGVLGSARWSEIAMPDPFDILGKARVHGLNYGAVGSYGPITSRSLIGIARHDRECTDTEIAEAMTILHQMHDVAAPPSDLTPAMLEALTLVGQGHRHTAAAAELGISESALKARLSSARIRLSARTTAEAVRKAREYGFLS